VLAASVYVVVPFALAGGSLIFLVFVVVLFFVVVYGYYTRRGSGISQTPYRRPDGPPESPSELAHDVTQDLRNWGRGTASQHRGGRPAAHQLPEPIAQALAEWRTGSGKPPLLDPPIGSADHLHGPEEAPTLAVYLDISSEPSRNAYRLLSELADARQIRLAVRQLPLADVHRLSLPAAEVLEAAAAQGKFFELLDLLANSKVTDETELLNLASQYVGDSDRLQPEAGAGRYRGSVEEQIHQATASGTHSVPAIFINGTLYDGPVTRDNLQRALRR
jgi:hypothetical protein